MMTQNSPNNNNPLGSLGGVLKVLQKKVVSRIILIVLTIILTVVLVFSMTVAWQTNVVQTGGITLTAETWDFSGEVVIDEISEAIAPGDSGVIGMSLKNESANLVAASVSVSRDLVEVDVRNRLFFYIDTPIVKNGENTDRVYIGKNNSYTYTMFPDSELILREDAGFFPVLKWEWAYDNLGYYVIGQMTQVENVSVVTVEDYLRPIEYAFDPMLTTFDENGNLLTVDGTTTAKEFLVELSKTDGYEGTIDVDNPTTANYYPVSVDESGYGVWAYLCTSSEIESGNVSDTELGEEGKSLGTVSITITGQNSHEKGIPVYNETTLLQALSATELNLVSLQDDVVLTQPIELSGSVQTMLDLNGHSLTSDSATIIKAEDGAELMIHNGTIDGGSQTSTAISAEGASLTLSSVTIQNVGEGVTVFDHNNESGFDSSVHLVGCNITSYEDGLLIYGNGDESENNTAIVVEDCEIEGQMYAGIICNGTYYGTDIQVKNSTVKGCYAAIYFPQKDSSLTITASELEGGTALVVKGGTVTVSDSVITGIGDYSATPLPEDPSELSKSGWWDTGDGIYLEANYTEWDTSITVSGENTRVISLFGEAVRQFPETETQATIAITGGTYGKSVEKYLPDGYSQTEKTETDGTTVYVVSAS